VTGVLVEASLRRVLLLSWLVPAWLVAVVATSATPALAAGPCGSSGVLSQSGSTVTCTYTYTGSDQAFATPQGECTALVEQHEGPAIPASCGVEPEPTSVWTATIESRA